MIDQSSTSKWNVGRNPLGGHVFIHEKVQPCWEKVSLPICTFRTCLEGDERLGGTAAPLWLLHDMHEDETLSTVVDSGVLFQDRLLRIHTPLFQVLRVVAEDTTASLVRNFSWPKGTAHLELPLLLPRGRWWQWTFQWPAQWRRWLKQRYGDVTDVSSFGIRTTQFQSSSRIGWVISCKHFAVQLLPLPRPAFLMTLLLYLPKALPSEPSAVWSFSRVPNLRHSENMQSTNIEIVQCHWLGITRVLNYS